MRLPLLPRAFLLALVALTPGCQSCSKAAEAPGTLDSAAVGPLGAVDDVDFAPYFSVAHAIVTHGSRPDVHPPQHAGQRAFVTFWSPGHPAVRASGLGATLLDSVTKASEEAAKTATGDGRVEIDVLTTAEAVPSTGEMRDSIFAIGTHGYLATDGDKPAGFVTPNEVLADKLVNLAKEKDKTLPLYEDKVRARLAERAAVAPAMLDGMHLARFGASEHVEGAKPGEPPIALVRSMPAHGADVTPEQLLAGVRAAADYLARMVDAQGRFTYLYDPIVDASPHPKEYGILRHAGAIYAMMEAYEELRVADWATAGERAVGFLVAKVQTTPDGAFVRDNADEEQQKVGGGGLSLVGLTKYQAATGDTRNLETMRALARFIVHQQYPDGHLRDNTDVAREEPSAAGKKLPKEVFYFVGEAMLGLVRLYALDPNPAWLASARKVADWVIDVRDAHDDLKHQIHDHWMSYALRDLYVLTGEQRYADHAFKIGHAIEVGEPKPPAAPDYAGAFYDAGEVTPTSTRLEAVASDIQLARALGQDEAWLRAMAVRYAAFMYGQQLDAENDYFARNPARAVGGVRESLLNSDVRIDYAQHAASGWLRLARELRDPGWGEVTAASRARARVSSLLAASIALVACARSGEAPTDAAVAVADAGKDARDPEAEEAAHRKALVQMAHEVFDAGPWEGAKLGATSFVTSVLSAPLWPEDDDGGVGSVRLGYLRHGARVAVIPEPILNDSCPDGWLELVQGGFVCGKNATLDPKNPRVRLAPHRPDLTRALPYDYGVNLSNGTPLYRRVLSLEDRKKYEPWLAPPRPVAAVDAGSSDEDDLDSGTPAAAPSASSAVSEVDASPPPWFLRDGGSKDVTLDDLHGRGVLVRRMIRGFVLGIDRDFKAAHAHWWRTTAGFATPFERVVLHHPPPEFRGAWLAGHADVARETYGGDAGVDASLADAGTTEPLVAVAFVRTSTAHALMIDVDKKKVAWGRALDKRSVVELADETYAANGTTYRETTRGEWVALNDVTIATPSAPPADLAEGEKWIDVDLTKQILVAFEGTRAVFATLVSSGKRDEKDKTKDHPTPTGTFRIQAKHVTSTMDGDVAADAPYSIEDVPWVMYFDGSYALHGAFWHSSFGYRMSHGCVNLSPADARELFSWTEPRLPGGWHGVFAIKPEDGTRVIIHE